MSRPSGARAEPDRPPPTEPTTKETPPTDASSAISERKADHLELALDASVDPEAGAGWGDVELAHASLPEVDLSEVELGTSLLTAQLRVPLVIAGMTGGHSKAEAINARLGAAAQRHGLAVGVGSQRAVLVDPSLKSSYAAIRKYAPDVYVIANIGISQLIEQHRNSALDVADIEHLVSMIGADALAVHLNFLEELVQPEGDRRARGGARAIETLCDRLRVPVIAKETGGGMTCETAIKLKALGVAALDVGGAGGTSFVAIERARAERRGDSRGVALGETFAGWGVPTPAAVAAAACAGLPVIATGGLRSGLDAAKALALGAVAVGVARPLLAAALEGDEALDAWIERFVLELRAAMFLTGCATPDQLASARVIVGGRTRTWIDGLVVDRDARTHR